MKTAVQKSSYLSFVISLILMAVKFWGYHLTSSEAIFSDATESIVNVIAAALAIVVILIASKPADQDHPYGHGKVEFFSAAFEGGLITLAALLICVLSIRSFLTGPVLTDLGLGLLIIIATGLANLCLGLYLYRVGKKHHSIAIMASGKHVMSDFITSAGVAVGLLAVKFTGFKWIDPACALIVGLFLVRTGLKLVRQSVGGLLDEEDRDILKDLLEVLKRDQPEGIIQVHHCRVMRSGNYHHIDAHAVVPEFWDVAEAHAQMDAFAAQVIRSYPYEGELHLHMDPCRRAYCRFCDVQNCPIRQQPFEAKRQLSIDELTSPEEPDGFRRRSLQNIASH